MGNKYSIIVPAYNEESGIGEVIDGIKTIMDGIECEYELIIVDDGSSDNTAGVIRQKGVRLIQNKKNRGYGASLKIGIHNAVYDKIIITDADSTYPPEFMGALAGEQQDYDMLVGARKGYQISIIRRPVKYLMNKFASFLAGAKIPDLNSGLRIFKKEIAEKYISYFPDGFSFTSTITLVMLCNNYLVRYKTIEYNKRKGKSKFHPIKDTFNLGSFIIRTTLYFNPLKIFFPASGFLFILAMGILLYSYFFTPKVMDITSIILTVSAFQIFAIGLLADLINKKK